MIPTRTAADAENVDGCVRAMVHNLVMELTMDGEFCQSGARG